MASALFGVIALKATAGMGWLVSSLITVGATMAGAVIDQMFLFPLLNTTRTERIGKIDELQIQTSTEGAPIKYCIGPENRLAGNIIWIGGLYEKKKSIEGSGPSG